MCFKGNLRSKKSYAQMKERVKYKKTSHHRPQCAQWFSRYSISKSGIWAIWASPFCRFLASFSLKCDVTDAMLQRHWKNESAIPHDSFVWFIWNFAGCQKWTNEFRLALIFVAMATQTRIISRFSKTKNYCFLPIKGVYHPFFFKTWCYLQQQSNCIVSNYFLNIIFA